MSTQACCTPSVHRHSRHSDEALSKPLGEQIEVSPSHPPPTTTCDDKKNHMRTTRKSVRVCNHILPNPNVRAVGVNAGLLQPARAWAPETLFGLGVANVTPRAVTFPSGNYLRLLGGRGAEVYYRRRHRYRWLLLQFLPGERTRTTAEGWVHMRDGGIMWIFTGCLF